MLERFVDYLQAALPRVRQSAVTLAQELELARAYLDIQQIRIGSRLTFTIEVPEEIAKLRFPLVPAPYEGRPWFLPMVGEFYRAKDRLARGRSGPKPLEAAERA